MFDFLIPFTIFGVGGYFLYKIFELYGMRSERKAIIERLDNVGLIEYVKRLPIGVGGGNTSAEHSPSNVVTMWPLRWGLAIMGLGAGIVCGYLISKSGFDAAVYNVYAQVEGVWLASACVGAGLGLFISFIVEMILVRKNNK